MRAAFRSLFTLLCATALAGACSTPTSAEVYEVYPGTEWSHLAAKLKPGDEIVLLPGKHIPALLEGVVGAPGNPIRIRPKKAGELAEIVPTREALKLVDCRHVRVERIVARDARRAGVIIEGTKAGGSRDVGLSDVLILGVKGVAEQSGIIVRDSSEIGILRSRIENCAGNGILLEDADLVTIDQVQVIARAATPMQNAIDLTGNCFRPTVMRFFASGSIDTAFAIGMRLPPKPTRPVEATPGSTVAAPDTSGQPKPPLVRELTVTQSRTRGVGRAIDLGSCDQAVVRNCSFIDTREELQRISIFPNGYGAGKLRFTDNLVVWEPAAIRRLGFADTGVDRSRFEFGPNLWWSPELPVALPRIGAEGAIFTGTLLTAQTMDLDPILDNQFYPTAEAAKRFGAPRP